MTFFVLTKTDKNFTFICRNIINFLPHKNATSTAKNLAQDFLTSHKSLNVIANNFLIFPQVMLYVDGMNGVMKHGPTVQWLYTLIASKYRLVVKTALKLLLVFVEYCEGNCYLLVNAIKVVDSARGSLPWSNIMKWVLDRYTLKASKLQTILSLIIGDKTKLKNN